MIIGDPITIEVHPGLAQTYRPVVDEPKPCTCGLCGQPCADDYSATDYGIQNLCKTCFVRFDAIMFPDMVPAGMELGGSGI